MSEPTTLTLARLIRDSADILLPLNRTDGDTAIRRIDFDLDVDRSDPRGLNGTVVLITEAAANLDRLLESYRGAAALVVAPGPTPTSAMRRSTRARPPSPSSLNAPRASPGRRRSSTSGSSPRVPPRLSPGRMSTISARSPR